MVGACEGACEGLQNEVRKVCAGSHGVTQVWRMRMRSVATAASPGEQQPTATHRVAPAAATSSLQPHCAAALPTSHCPFLSLLRGSRTTSPSTYHHVSRGSCLLQHTQHRLLLLAQPSGLLLLQHRGQAGWVSQKCVQPGSGCGESCRDLSVDTNARDHVQGPCAPGALPQQQVSTAVLSARRTEQEPDAQKTLLVCPQHNSSRGSSA